MIVVSTLVASITYTIGLFEKIATTYAWLQKAASTKWKEDLDKYIKYLQVVKEVTTPYETSNCSKTAITGALKLLDEELKESWSKVDEWMPTTRFYKQLNADDFINEMKSSRTTIHQNLQLFSTAVQTWERKEKKEFEEEEKKEFEEEENEYKDCEFEEEVKKKETEREREEREDNEYKDWLAKEKKKEREREENEYKDWLAKEKEKEREENEYKNDLIVIFFGIASLVGITKWTVIFFRIIAWLAIFFGIGCLVVITKWTVIFFRIIAKWTEIFSGIACLIAFSYVKLRLMEVRRKRRKLEKEKEKEKQKQKEKEENEYKAWLKENITDWTKWTDGWPSYKTGWEGATISKLDLAERKRLFENHVLGLLSDSFKSMPLSRG